MSKKPASEFGERIQRRHQMVIEEFPVDRRLSLEREYAADPVRKHSELTYDGYWLIASQLKIDHAVGRLEGQTQLVRTDQTAITFPVRD